MVSQETHTRHELKEMFIILPFMILVSFGLSTFTLFVIGGFESINDPDFVLRSGFVILYLVFAIVGLVVLIGLKIREIFRTSNKEPFSYVALHDFDSDSLLGKLPLPFFLKNIFRSWWKTFILFSIFFAIIGLISTQTNIFFSATPSLTQQQINPFAKVFFSVEPASASENLSAYAVLFILYGLLRLMQRKLNLSDAVFWSTAILILPLILGGYWMGYHSLAYGSEEVKLLSTFLFGYFGALFTLLFGSILVWWAWHQQNNLFFELNKLFSNEQILVVTLSILFFIAVIFTVYLFITRNKKEFIEKVLA